MWIKSKYTLNALYYMYSILYPILLRKWLKLCINDFLIVPFFLFKENPGFLNIKMTYSIIATLSSIFEKGTTTSVR